MNSNNLSHRLQRVAEDIIKYSAEPIRLADIGSDHAYLPCHLALKQLIEFAVAGEVVEGPYLSAVNEVNNHNLNHMIEVRLGDGLNVLTEEDRVNVASICGMGGALIVDILQEGWQLGHRIPCLVLQPNIAESKVRQWLMDHQYQIVDEHMIHEHNRYYEIITARLTEEVHALTDDELIFGPFLLQEKSNTFIAKWEKELTKAQYIQASLDLSSTVSQERKDRQQQTIQRIERVIHE